MVKTCTVTPGGAPIPLTEDAVSSSAVSAAYCELACTESCERVSPLRAVGDDITVSAQNFLQRKFSTATLELDNLRLQPVTKVPCVPLETIPNTTEKLSLDSLKKNSSSSKSWFQLFCLTLATIPRQPPLGISSDSFVYSFTSRLQKLRSQNFTSPRFIRLLDQLRNQFVARRLLDSCDFTLAVVSWDGLANALRLTEIVHNSTTDSHTYTGSQKR